MYLVAKYFDKPGSYVIKMEPSKTLAKLVSYLSLRKLEQNVQVLTISDKEVYGEYAPYMDINSEAEFIIKVLEM